MIAPECFLLSLLKGRIVVNANIVPIVRKSHPVSVLPSITLDNTGGSVIEDTYIVHAPEEHRVNEISTRVKIHVWSTKEDERTSIVAQIKECNNKCLANHFQFCTRYKKGRCTVLDTECEAQTVDNGRTRKNQCSYPADNGYENLFSKYKIKKDKYKMQEYYNLDEYNTVQKTLHSIIPVEFTYIDDYTIGGEPFDEIELKEELI